MSNEDVLNSNLKDLNIAFDLAEDTNNAALKSYISNRLELLEKNKKMYQYVTINTLVDSYIIDLELFINVSMLINDIESKDYFKSRIIEMIKEFSYLGNRRDIIGLL